MPKSTLPRLLASVQLQVWNGSRGDDLTDIRAVTFDATSAVLAQSFDEVQTLADRRECSDVIVEASCCPAFAQHDGPYGVDVEDALENFLGQHGTTREKLDPAAWAGICAKYKAEPTRDFVVTVRETLVRERQVRVRAKSDSQAFRQAQAVSMRETRRRGWKLSVNAAGPCPRVVLRRITPR